MALDPSTYVIFSNWVDQYVGIGAAGGNPNPVVPGEELEPWDFNLANGLYTICTGDQCAFVKDHRVFVSNQQKPTEWLINQIENGVYTIQTASGGEFWVASNPDEQIGTASTAKPGTTVFYIVPPGAAVGV